MKKLDVPGKVIFICDGKKCGKYKEVRKGFKHVIKESGLKHEIEVVRMDCTDNCKNAPVVCLQPQNVWIGEVEEHEIPAILNNFYTNNQ
jgi:(2Fe-2S) ferredoxin